MQRSDNIVSLYFFIYRKQLSDMKWGLQVPLSISCINMGIKHTMGVCVFALVRIQPHHMLLLIEISQLHPLTPPSAVM